MLDVLDFEITRARLQQFVKFLMFAEFFMRTKYIFNEKHITN